MIIATGLVISLKLDTNHRFPGTYDFPILMDDLAKQKCAGFMLWQALYIIAMPSIHRWIWTRVTVLKCSIWVKSPISLAHVNLKFDGWPWKIIGHIFYATSSFCSNRSIQIGVIVRKHPIWFTIGNLVFHVTLKFDRWSWKTIGHIFFILQALCIIS